MTEYVEFLKEVFEQFGKIQSRRMIGGYGLFHKGSVEKGCQRRSRPFVMLTY